MGQQQPATPARTVFISRSQKAALGGVQETKRWPASMNAALTSGTTGSVPQ